MCVFVCFCFLRNGRRFCVAGSGVHQGQSFLLLKFNRNAKRDFTNEPARRIISCQLSRNVRILCLKYQENIKFREKD